MTDIIREEARLIILRELHDQDNYALNESLLRETLDSFGISKSRDWLREELRWLVDVGAISLSQVATVYVARLTPKGGEHVERRLIIPGIKRPSPPRD